MTQPTFTLLIWEEIPESIKLYVIPDANLDDDDRKVLEAVQGNYINEVGLTDEEHDALNCINAALTENPEHLPKEHPADSKWACRFQDYKQEMGPLGVVISRVVQCGFLL